MREPSKRGPGTGMAPRFYLYVDNVKQITICCLGQEQNKNEPMATKEDLFYKTKKFIIDLSNKTCLSSFYIGKAKDVEERQLKHAGEGYFCSIEIAKSSSFNKIDDAEKYLIAQFKKEIMPITFDNENNGGGGNPKADRLYVSLRFNMAFADDLDDADEENLFFGIMEI